MIDLKRRNPLQAKWVNDNFTVLVNRPVLRTGLSGMNYHL